MEENRTNVDFTKAEYTYISEQGETKVLPCTSNKWHCSLKYWMKLANRKRSAHIDGYID